MVGPTPKHRIAHWRHHPTSLIPTPYSLLPTPYPALNPISPALARLMANVASPS